MPNGLSNQNRRLRSRGGNKRPPPAPPKDIADNEALTMDNAPEQDELTDAVLETEPDSIAPEALDNDVLEGAALEADAEETPPARTARDKRAHALRLIEARLEEKRLKAMLKEVYDED